MDKYHQNHKMYGWTEEHFNDVCREFDEKWRNSRHLYMSSTQLQKVLAQEKNA
jgi:hypothetical protein